MANTIAQILKIQDKLNDPPFLWFKDPQVWRQQQLEKQLDLFLQLSDRDFVKSTRNQIFRCAELFKKIISDQWIREPNGIKQRFEEIQSHLATLDEKYAQPFVISPRELLRLLHAANDHRSFSDDIQQTAVEYLLRISDEKGSYGYTQRRDESGSFSSQIIFDYLSKNNLLDQHADFMLYCIGNSYHRWTSPETEETAEPKLLAIRDVVLKQPDLLPSFAHEAFRHHNSLNDFFSMEQLHDILYNLSTTPRLGDDLCQALENMKSVRIPIDQSPSREQITALERVRELGFFCRYTTNQVEKPDDRTDIHHDPDYKIWTSKSSSLTDEDFDMVAKWADAWAEKFGDSVIAADFMDETKTRIPLRLLRKIFATPELCSRLIHDKESAEKWIKFANFIYTEYAYNTYTESGRWGSFESHSPYYPDHEENSLKSLVQSLWRRFLPLAKQDPSIIPMILKELPCEGADIRYLPGDMGISLDTRTQILSQYPNYKPNSLDPKYISQFDRRKYLDSWMDAVTVFLSKDLDEKKPSLHAFLQNTDFSSQPDNLRYLFDRLLKSVPAPENRHWLWPYSNWVPILAELAAKCPDRAQWQDLVGQSFSALKENPGTVTLTLDFWPALTQWMPPKEAKEVMIPLIKESRDIACNPDQYIAHIMDIFAESPQEGLAVLRDKTTDNEFVKKFPKHFKAVWDKIRSSSSHLSQEDLFKHLKKCSSPHISGQNLCAFTKNLLEILPLFPDDLEFKKKITNHISDSLKDKPLSRHDLAVLSECINPLMIGKTHKDRSELSPQLQLLHKMRLLSPSETKYFLSFPFPNRQDGTDIGPLLSYDFNLYHKVFTTLFERQDKKDGNADGDYLAPLTHSLVDLFGKNYSGYLGRVLPHVSASASAVNFLPSCTKLQTFTEEQKNSLCKWLMDNVVYPVDGKFHMRPTSELNTICSRWRHLSEEEIKLPYKELLIVAETKATYTNITNQEFALEAMKANVSDDVYSYAEDFFKAAQSVPEAFSSSVRFTADGLTGRFLPRSDPRSISFGQYTDCCQYLENAGKPCAVSSAIDPFAGCFVLEDEAHQIVAGSFVWRTNLENGIGVCFDNVEALGGYKDKPALNKIYEQAAQYLIQQGARIVTVGKGCSDMVLSDYSESKQLLEQNIYKGYSDAQKGQFVLAQTDTPVPQEDRREAFFTRPLLVAYPLDERGKIRDAFPADQSVSELSHKIPLDHRTILIDKDGYVQGFAFANPENNTITFDLKQDYHKKNPKALNALWTSLIPHLSRDTEKPWSVAVTDEHTLGLIQQLQQQNLLRFDETKTIETYPCTIGISLPEVPQNKTFSQTLQEVSAVPPKKEEKKTPVIPPDQHTA